MAPLCMFSRIIRILVAVSLMLSIGLHWDLLQIVAWGGMLVKYAQDGSIQDAIEKTFDGEHPCPMCKAIKKAKREEKRAPQQPVPTQKSDLYCTATALTVIAPPPLGLLCADSEAAAQFHVPPPVPPPRCA